MTKEEKAIALFQSGYSCAQAVYLSCRDESLMSEEAAVLASGAFGGGVGGLEQSCGALCGAMMVLSERFSPLNPAFAEQKQRSRAYMQAFGAWFENEFGSCMCSAIKPLSKPHENGNKACTEYVAACVQKLCEAQAPFTTANIEYLSKEYEKELDIRQAELREPLGMNLFEEDLSHEASCLHLGVYLKDELVGTLYLQPITPDCMQIRQVAVKKAYQSLGAGKLLMLYAEKVAKERGFKMLHIHSRETAQSFYAQLGYTLVGEADVEVGLPHVHLEKAL